MQQGGSGSEGRRGSECGRNGDEGLYRLGEDTTIDRKMVRWIFMKIKIARFAELYLLYKF
ncbi:MAG: hypothetical protein WA102_04985 [Candidatus Methanoperedens sp.]